MGDSAQVSFDSSTFEKNLDALRRVDSALARRVEQISLPSGAAVARARDGNVSIAWDGDGGRRWLGGTSAPSARARGLIDSFQAGSGNCLFLGIGAGTEAVELLGRMPVTGALFVLESDIVNAAMALRVVDLSGEIGARRLVLIVGDDGWSRLRFFLSEHEGFLAPQRVLAWPWLTRDEQDEIGRRLTSVAAEIGAERERAMAGTRAASRSADCESSGAIAVVSLSADARHVSAAGGIGWGIEQHGHAARVFCADAPSRMHAMALSRFLAGSECRKIILLNTPAAALCDWLPPGVPVVTWWTSDAAIPGDCARGVDSNPGIVVSTPAQRDAVSGGGVGERNVIVAPAAGRPGSCVMRRPVVLLADADDDRAEAAGLHLASHVALWDAAKRALSERPAVLANEVDAMISRAEAESGVRIGDAAVRQGVFDRIRRVLAPAVVLRGCVDRLRSASIAVEIVVGRRTPSEGTAYAAVLQLSADATPTCELLNAVADGAIPIVWSTRGRMPEAMSAVIPAELARTVSSADEFVAAVTLAMDGRESGAAREYVLRHHTWRERVALVLNTPV